MTQVKLSTYKKTFVFNVPDESRWVVPCYYPNTERLELRIGKQTIKPIYVIEDNGDIVTEAENVIDESRLLN